MSTSYQHTDSLQLDSTSYTIYSFDALKRRFPVDQLPYCLKILLENLLRHGHQSHVTDGDIEFLANWNSQLAPSQEIAFVPARVLLQDFTGVPAIVDLAAMRDAMVALGRSANQINPLSPVELVIDHSVMVYHFGSADAFNKNAVAEMARNLERYQFLRWGQTAFKNISVEPPSTGIVPQVKLEYRAKVVCTANTAHQLSDVLWSEIGKWHRKLPEGMRRLLEIKSDKIELAGVPDSFAVARTSRREQPEALQGFHSENLLFVIDEASGVPDVVFEVGQGALSTEGAKVVMTGNPTRTTGYFYDAFNKNRKRWWGKKVSCHDADTVDKAFLEDMVAQYGDGSNQYRVRVLGEFPAGDDDALIARHLIETATTRPVEPSQTAPVVWGLDVARFGDDSTTLAKRRGNAITEPIKMWRGKDLMETCGLIKVE